MKLQWLKLILSIVLTSMAGFVGSLFTFDSVRTWYLMIQKPSFNPPSWIFGPVWTTLYVLMGISFYLVWIKGFETKTAKVALMLFIAQLVLNALWSILFFGLHSPLWAFVEIVFLWAMIVMTIFFFYRISQPSAYLLVPYILWVSFAAILNFSIYWLNR